MTEKTSSANGWIDYSKIPPWWFFIGIGISMWIQGIVIIGLSALHLGYLTPHTDSLQAAIALTTWAVSGAPGAWVLNLSMSIQRIWWVSIIIGVYVGFKTEWGNS